MSTLRFALRVASTILFAIPVYGQGTGALEFSIDSADFVTRSDLDRFDRPKVDLVVALKIRNVSDRTYWFDAKPAKDGDATKFVPEVNEFHILTRAAKQSWHTRFKNTYSRIPVRTSLPPGGVTHLMLRSEQSPERYAEVARFGVPFSLSRDMGSATLWSADFEFFSVLVLKRMGLSPIEVFKDPPHGIRSLRIESVKMLQDALDSNAELANVVELRIGGKSLSADATEKQIERLLASLPNLESVLFGESTPASRLTLAVKLPRLKRLTIWEDSPELGEPLAANVAKRLQNLPPTLRSVSIDANAHVHPSLFRALARNESLERLTVGEVDDDASVLDGLSIDDFRPLRDSKLLRLYVNYGVADWSKEERKELEDLYHLIRKRGEHVELIRRRLRSRERAEARDESNSTGQLKKPQGDAAEVGAPNVPPHFLIGAMDDREFATFTKQRNEAALQLLAEENYELQPRSTRAPPIGIDRGGKLMTLPRQGLVAREVTNEGVKQIAEALPHFPEISVLSISMKDGTKFPIEVLRRARHLPDLRWLFLHTKSGWPTEALQLAAEHRRLERLTSVNLYDQTPETSKAFAGLSKLKNLERLDFYAQSPTCFETLAALPNLTVSYMTLGKASSDQPISAATREAMAKLNGRRMTIGIEGYCHPSLVRALWSVESMKSLTLMAHTPSATVHDFRGVEKLDELSYLTLSPISVDDQTRNAVREIEMRKKRRLKARVARERRRTSSVNRDEQQLSQAPKAISEQQVDAWIVEMVAKGRQFSPTPVLAGGDESLLAMLRRIFPESFREASQFTEGEARRLMEELDDDAFVVRNSATEKLKKQGRPYRSLLEEYATETSPEVKSRIAGILAAWSVPSGLGDFRFSQAWKQYLEGLSEYSSDKLLADACCKALEHGVHESDRKVLLDNSLRTLARSQEPELHARFAELCELDDEGPAIFALERLGGQVLTDLHRAGLASDNWSLKRSALRNLPSPQRYDAKFRTLVHKIVNMVFAADATREVAGAESEDRDILAVQYIEVPAARAHLLNVAMSGDPKRSSQAIIFLSDSRHFRQPPRNDVVQVLDHASKSQHEEVRLAAAQATMIYKLRNESSETLLRLLNDNSEQVWQTATSGLLQQQVWIKLGESKLNVIERLREENEFDSGALRSRNETIVKLLDGKAEFDWVAWPN